MDGGARDLSVIDSPVRAAERVGVRWVVEEAAGLGQADGLATNRRAGATRKVYVATAPEQIWSPA